MKLQIEIPDTFDVESLGATVTVPLGKFAPAIVARLVTHGLNQKIGNATAGIVGKSSPIKESGPFKDLTGKRLNAVVELATENMSAIVSQLVDGNWGRARGEGLSTLDREIVSIVRKLVAAQHADAYKKADSDGRDAMVDKALAALDESAVKSITIQAEANLARKAADRKRLAELGGDVKVSVK